jgi:hypothetical protein
MKWKEICRQMAQQRTLSRFIMVEKSKGLAGADDGPALRVAPAAG